MTAKASFCHCHFNFSINRNLIISFYILSSSSTNNVVSSELAITRKCNRLLTETVVQLERNALTNAQYHQQESVEVNCVSPSISDEELKLNICKALSLTRHKVKPDDLQV